MPADKTESVGTSVIVMLTVSEPSVSSSVTSISNAIAVSSLPLDAVVPRVEPSKSNSPVLICRAMAELSSPDAANNFNKGVSASPVTFTSKVPLTVELSAPSIVVTATLN